MLERRYEIIGPIKQRVENASKQRTTEGGTDGLRFVRDVRIETRETEIGDGETDKGGRNPHGCPAA